MKKKNRFQILILVICIGVAFILYSAINTWAGIPDFHSLFTKFSFQALVKILLFSIVAYTFKFIAWHINLTYLGAEVPIIFDLQSYLAGYLFLPTPARAGTSIRIYYLRKYAPYTLSIPALVLERINDLTATIICSLLIIQDSFYWLLLVIILPLLFITISILKKTNKNNWQNIARQTTTIVKKFIPHVLLEKIKNLSIATKQIIQSRQFLLNLPAFIGSQLLFCFAYVSYGLVVYTALIDLQINISAWQVIGIYSLSIFLGSISFLPVGLGGTEAMMIFFLYSWNISKVDAVVATIISRLCTIWLIVLVGLITTIILLFNQWTKNRS